MDISRKKNLSGVLVHKLGVEKKLSESVSSYFMTKKKNSKHWILEPLFLFSGTTQRLIINVFSVDITGAGR